MKKLTIKALKEMLNKNYMIRNYINIIKLGDAFYVVYRDKVACYRYSAVCGWCFSINGASMYSDTKALINLVSVLDDEFTGDINSND